MTQATGMPLEEVVRIISTIRGTGCRFWLEGGWGVDALIGHQTRPHRDLDVDVDVLFEDEVLTALDDLKYRIETDWRPNRVELVVPGRGWVDVHPLVIDENGDARQAALDGGWHDFPRSFFTVGKLGEASVPCVSAEAQRAFRIGYELREVDRHDLSLLDRLR